MFGCRTLPGFRTAVALVRRDGFCWSTACCATRTAAAYCSSVSGPRVDEDGALWCASARNIIAPHTPAVASSAHATTTTVVLRIRCVTARTPVPWSRDHRRTVRRAGAVVTRSLVITRRGAALRCADARVHL